MTRKQHRNAKQPKQMKHQYSGKQLQRDAKHQKSKTTNKKTQNDHKDTKYDFK